MARTARQQRELQKYIDQAQADEVVGFKVERLIEAANLEFNKLLETDPDKCNMGLTAFVYDKLVKKGYIQE